MEQGKVSIIKILEYLGSATIEANALQARCVKYEGALKEALDTLKWVKKSMRGDYFNVLDKAIKEINEALSAWEGQKQELPEPRNWNDYFQNQKEEQ